MLPQILSNEICSLKPDELRMTISVFMDYDLEGKLLKGDV